jgi:hypothetical protein
MRVHGAMMAAATPGSEPAQRARGAIHAARRNTQRRPSIAKPDTTFPWNGYWLVAMVELEVVMVRKSKFVDDIILI